MRFRLILSAATGGADFSNEVPMSSNSRNRTGLVVGAGLMGRGIAHGLLLAGYEVRLVDVDAAILGAARENIARILDAGVELGKLDPVEAKAALDRLSLSTDIESASAGCVLAIETATESLEIKLRILRTIDPLLDPSAIIGTNTSALSITEIASAVADPGRVVGMHFFNPVHKMKLLELVAGLATTELTLARAREVGEEMGKTVIIVSDSPGLTTSRMSAILGNEAMNMLAEGVASAQDIDTALRLGFNHPMGPLELGDLTGWDTRLKVLEYLHALLGERFRPNPLIRKMVKSGRIGRKAGAGVYCYAADGTRVPNSGLKASAQ